jgi:hypothetical protein
MYEKKEAKQISGTDVIRYRRAYPHPKLAEANTQFIFDHKQQAAVIPDRRPKALIEASTQRDMTSPHQAMNHNGRSSVFGAIGRVELGGSPDEPGLAGRIGSLGPARGSRGKISDPMGNQFKKPR